MNEETLEETLSVVFKKHSLKEGTIVIHSGRHTREFTGLKAIVRGYDGHSVEGEPRYLIEFESKWYEADSRRIGWVGDTAERRPLRYYAWGSHLRRAPEQKTAKLNFERFEIK